MAYSVTSCRSGPNETVLTNIKRQWRHLIVRYSWAAAIAQWQRAVAFFALRRAARDLARVW